MSSSHPQDINPPNHGLFVVPFGVSRSPWVGPGSQALTALPDPSSFGSVPGGTQGLPTPLGGRTGEGGAGEGVSNTEQNPSTD